LTPDSIGSVVLGSYFVFQLYYRRLHEFARHQQDRCRRIPDTTGGAFRKTILTVDAAATTAGQLAPPATQTIVQTGESARVIQFALKFQF